MNMPDGCPRGLTTCTALSRIESDGCGGFICVGQNDGSDRELEQDKYTYCWKNDVVDQRDHMDKRDLTHTASVILGALAIIEEVEGEQ